MNVFEDLVIELKEENLLEDTVMSNTYTREPSVSKPLAEADLADDQSITSDPSPALQMPVDHPRSGSEPSVEAESTLRNEPHNEALPIGHDAAPAADLQLMGSDETIEIRRANSELEFFKKRASGELSSLQMVEHVLGAVEREQMRIIPRSYDDLEAKKALHAFMQVANDVSSDQHKQAEFRLMQETESWCSALAARDREISVSALRRYCETCRPMLSSQAMLALARFYRNLPYSESIRGKFDFIITRLFSRAIDDQTRKQLFTAEEMLGHIKTLYADWSSIPLYSADDDSKIELTVVSFRELADEAEHATQFDSLIKSDFFGRLRLFKESIAELFFAPRVTAAAIESNVRIGNQYVELIDKERRISSAAAVHDKYGFLDDQAVSEAAGRTLELNDILRELAQRPESQPIERDSSETEAQEVESKETVETSRPAITFGDALPNRKRRFENGILGINKWLILGGLLMILASGGLWIYANFFVAADQATIAGVKKLDVETLAFREHIKIAKISGDTFYGVLQPTWETMPKEKREDLLKNIYQAGQQGGWVNVNLINAQGKTVGFASPTHFDLADK